MPEPDLRWSLANERTLLAYNRTGLAFLVSGLAVAGSRGVADTSVWFALLGLPLIAIGAAAAWAGRLRYVAAEQAMQAGEPLPPPAVAMFLPTAVVVIALAAAVVATVELLGD